MRLSLLLLIATACSNNNPTPDGGGVDAAADVTQSQDGAPDAPSDGGSCNVTAAATVMGTFLGQSLAAQDTIAFEVHTTQYEVVVGITDFKGECALGDDHKANANVVAFIYEAATPLVVPATIDLAQTNVLFVKYTHFDATCQSSQGESASSGTVTFTRADDCAVEGTFDLMFGTDHVTGLFASPICANVPDGGAGACK